MDVDVLVVGAGVVGLACAARLRATGRTVLVIERRSAPGLETSSRNSEVIHAGLYYPPGSLKSSCCVEGRRDLYDRCRIYQIPHRKLGKFVVATRAEECATLAEIRARALANGAGDLRWIEPAELARAEPRVRAVAALWSPESGIVDARALLHTYQMELENAGGAIALRTELIALERRAGGWCATAENGAERTAIAAAAVVNAAGLGADAVAALAGIDPDAAGYRQQPCKGDYFAVAPGLGPLTRHLVYPVPVAAGLGIHVTVDLGGRYRLGPDTEYVSEARYDVDPDKAEAFAAAARRYLPELTAEHLAPDFAGIRPKLQGPGQPFRDFVIEEATAHGAERLVNLLGIESPGLTSASAIARRVVALLD
jgi:L-2-hydroxyglutarate oxidase LhgO